ncbi:MAG TPA: hypothetical protein VF712_18190 [Thermoleophilaceae bacterium]|jgi:hypothetical protein
MERYRFMTKLLHDFDAEYGALPDFEVEAMWRHAVLHDPDAREPLLRQLVLRAAAVIDETVRREGAAAGFTERDVRNAFDEAAQRLMSRLRVDVGVRDVRAVAHQLAREVVADPDRRRAPARSRFAPPPRPRLHLVDPERGR